MCVCACVCEKKTERERERDRELVAYCKVWNFFFSLILFHVMGLVLRRRTGTEKNMLSRWQFLCWTSLTNRLTGSWWRMGSFACSKWKCTCAVLKSRDPPTHSKHTADSFVILLKGVVRKFRSVVNVWDSFFPGKSKGRLLKLQNCRKYLQKKF